MPVRLLPGNLFFLTTLFLLNIMAGAGSAHAQTAADIQAWLNAHNQYRALHGVPPVAWSATVAASAQAYVNTCPSGHSSSPYGENILFANYVLPPADVVAWWYSEETLYDYDNPGFSSETGHFTQVVWKSTAEIGCGYRGGCGGYWSNIWVCQYNPPGNYIGQFAENVFPPSTPPPPSLPPPRSGSGALLPAILHLLLD